MSRRADIDIDVTRNGGSSVVHVEGNINWETSPKVRDVILDLFENRGQGRVVVDLTGTKSIDSSGVSTLVEGLQAAKKRNAQLILSGLNDSARRVLELTRLIGFFEIR